MADGATLALPRTEAQAGASLKRYARRRSTTAILMTLPLIAVIGGLVAWPAGYAIYLSPLNRRMTLFIGLTNFEILLDSDSFRMVIFQSMFFAITAVILKAASGFWLAHMLHHIPTKGQRKWRGMLLVPWVIPPAFSRRRSLMSKRSARHLPVCAVNVSGASNRHGPRDSFRRPATISAALVVSGTIRCIPCFGTQSLPVSGHFFLRIMIAFGDP